MKLSAYQDGSRTPRPWILIDGDRIPLQHHTGHALRFSSKELAERWALVSGHEIATAHADIVIVHDSGGMFCIAYIGVKRPERFALVSHAHEYIAAHYMPIVTSYKDFTTIPLSSPREYAWSDGFGSSWGYMPATQYLLPPFNIAQNDAYFYVIDRVGRTVMDQLQPNEPFQFASRASAEAWISHDKANRSVTRTRPWGISPAEWSVFNSINCRCIATPPLPEPKMKPFNLEAFKAGKAAVTRGGQTVRFVAYDERFKLPLLVQLAGNDRVSHYTANGQAGAVPHNADLVMKTVKVRAKVYLYSDGHAVWRREHETIMPSYPSPFTMPGAVPVMLLSESWTEIEE